MAEGLRAVEVRLWGRSVGAVAPDRARPGVYRFQYAPEFVRSGVEISPRMMKLRERPPYSFPTLNRDTFHGLPGLVADALPDKFGNALIDEYFTRAGAARRDITTLQRLVYVGKRAMGALEFEPADADTGHPAAARPLEMARLVEDARRALRGDFRSVAQSIIEVGSSAGGARAKAVIGWNERTGEVVSGQFDVPPGYEHWLLKFDGVGDDGRLGAAGGFGRVEYAHYLMAVDCGIEMSPCRLLEEGGRAHFMTRRFDRLGNTKVHMQSLCGLEHLDFNLPYVHGYEQFLRTVLALNIGAQAIEQGWLRCVFNVMARNCDDHTKNIAFTMAEGGRWELAPAYDLCFAHNPAPDRWTHQHQMLVAGKAQGITADDLRKLGDDFGVHRPLEKMARVADVIARWPGYAVTAGVADEDMERIRGFQELLGFGRT